MSDVPSEVINEILTRLPVKSLMKFRCISKSFKSRIDSPKFIEAQLNQQTLKPNSDLFSVDFNSICNGVSTQQPIELEHLLKQLHRPTQVLGSCYGLFFISNNLKYNVVVWNPSTKMFRRLPICPTKPPSRTPRGLGFVQICGSFGYDDSDNDYKVVRTTQSYHPYDQPSLVSEVMVYSLKLPMWKKDPLSRGISLTLVGFNLGSERFEEMSFPQNMGKPCRLNLTVLGECLCLILGYVSSTNTNVLNHIDLWVMKAYGVKESWVKLFSVGQLEGVHYFRHLGPISYSMIGREVLLEINHRKFMWYYLEEKALNHVTISVGLDNFESFVGLGTLVPLYEGENERTEL
ncbi:hypothetical protein BC332_00967 [Capsicum chinense]|nr:hypothetical protein BC332_00967 [Capsicum chinense]